MKKSETGRRGEDLALDWLLAHGFTLRDRNWRGGHKELDLVMESAERVHIVEVKTRGALILAVTNEENTEIEKVADFVLYIPHTNPYFTNSLAIIPLQLFAYYVSVGKGCDVDKPRNLAKSVTVE